RSTAELDLESTANGLRADLQWLTSGVTLQGLTPWLQPLGIASELQDGELRASLSADLSFTEQAIKGSVQVANLQFRDGDNKLLALRSVRGADIDTTGPLNIGTWTVAEPFLSVRRDLDQTLHVLGLRLGQAEPAVASTKNSSPTSNQPVAKQPATTAKPRVLRTPNTLEPSVLHGELNIEQVAIALTDARYPD